MLKRSPCHPSLVPGAICVAILPSKPDSQPSLVPAMQRASRLKRELTLLATEPPPGITCWQDGDRMDDLHARRCHTLGKTWWRCVCDSTVTFHPNLFTCA